jgi:sulfite reductase alpha subunit-like flavoprotein
MYQRTNTPKVVLSVFIVEMVCKYCGRLSGSVYFLEKRTMVMCCSSLISEVSIYLLFQTSGSSLCVFILPTYAEGKPPESAAWFCKWLEEASSDFRVEKELLKGLKFAVFGLGNSLYRDHFNEVSQFHY